MSKELDHLIHGPDRNESPSGIGTTRFIASCPSGNANEVLAIAKNTLEVAIRLSHLGQFEENAWAVALPERFVRNSAPNDSLDKVEHESTLPLEARLRLDRDKKWSIQMFMNSFLPDLNLKQWTWWDASVLDTNHIAVDVEIDSWPFAWSSLRWLFRGSGAIDLESET